MNSGTTAAQLVFIEYLARRVFVDNGELLPAGRQVQTPDRRIDLEQVDREGVVNEDLDDLAILEAEEEAFALRGTTDNLKDLLDRYNQQKPAH